MTKRGRTVTLLKVTGDSSGENRLVTKGKGNKGLGKVVMSRKGQREG